MHVFMVLCVLGFLGASTCVNEVEYADNYADSYDNEISQDQQMGECPLFILLFNFDNLHTHLTHSILALVELSNLKSLFL